MSYAPPLNPNWEGLTSRIVNVWKGLFKRAESAKHPFNNRGDQVMSFYSGGPGAMWSPEYAGRFLGGVGAIAPPRFKVTLNLAFEQVAILGPLLFWEMADRKVAAYRSLQLDPKVLAGGDPNLEEYFGALADQQALIDARNAMRAQILEPILNYTQREQPAGGLSAHSELAVFEALTKGAGFLKTEDYRFPFSERTLVGSFFEPVDNVLVDADCTDPLWTTARWVAIRHSTPVNEAEEYFKLPRNSLKEYASMSSASATYQSANDKTKTNLNSKDLIEWYEVFSRAGFGNYLTGERTNPPIAEEFDDVRGYVEVGGQEMRDDFPYLCICPKCPFPLNLYPGYFESDGATPEWIKAQTDWPTEYWRDNKWPVEMLWFYPHSGTSPWPEPPLAPAIGELTCLNILMSAYVEQGYQSRQQVIFYLKGAVPDVRNLETSDKNPLMIEVDPAMSNDPTIGRALEQCIAFAKRPEVNGDLLQVIQFLREMVEKRTGLREELYGGTSGAEPRSAAAYEGKMNTVNIRPEFMQKKVAAFQSRVADKEVFCLYKHCTSADLQDQLGPLGMPAWDELITKETPEAILRGCKCLVEASGIRRPNKQKDMADLQAMIQYYLPIAAGELAQNGNAKPINGIIKAIGKAGEFPVDELLFHEPEPDPEQQQMQMASQQAELAKVQAEGQKLQAEAQKAMADAEATANSAQSAEQDAQTKMAVAEHGMGLKERQAELAATGKQQEMANKQQTHQQAIQERVQQATQKLAASIMQAHQNLNQNAATHLQQTAIADQKANDDAKRGNLITYQRMLQSATQHKQKMQQASESGSEGSV